MDLGCPHFKDCSGCLCEKNIEKPPVFYETAAYFSEQGIAPLNLHTGRLHGWRCRAKLAVRNPLAQVGLFKAGTHDLVDIPHCRVHHPAINRGAEILRRWMAEAEIFPYDESSGGGIIRYLQFTLERSSQRVQLALIINSLEESAPLKQVLHSLWESHPDLWHSIWLNYNTRRDNVILGNEWRLFKGEEWLWESLNGVEICFHPASFMQANLEMFEQLILRIREFVPRGANLVEFYAGVGAIGLSVASVCKQVTCVEIAPSAQRCFEINCQKLSPEIASRASFVSAGVADALKVLEASVDVVIVDPPRKGLDLPLLKALCHAQNLQRIIYVSCGWKSFLRDSDAFLKNGWKIVAADAYLFFPGSDHLETLTLFERM